MGNWDDAKASRMALCVIGGLAAATYRVEVAFTTTSAAIATKTIDAAAQSYLVFHAPVP